MFQRFFAHPLVGIVAVLALAGLAGLSARASFNYWWIAIVLAGVVGIYGFAEQGQRRGWWGAIRRHIPMDFHSPVTIRLRSIATAAPERGFIDFERAFMTGIADMTAILERMGQEMVRAGTRAQENARKMLAVQGAPIAKRQSVIDRIARDINAHAFRLSDLEGKYRRSSEQMRSNALNLIDTVPSTELRTMGARSLRSGGPDVRQYGRKHDLSQERGRAASATS